MGGLPTVGSANAPRAIGLRFVLYALAFVGVVKIPSLTVTLTSFLVLLTVAAAHSSQTTPIYFVLVGMLMPFVEIGAVNMSIETWRYAHREVVGVPIWLMPLWALTGQWLLDLHDLSKCYRRLRLSRLTDDVP